MAGLHRLGVMIIQARTEADWTGLWDYALPHVHATEETVAHIRDPIGLPSEVVPPSPPGHPCPRHLKRSQCPQPRQPPGH